MQVAEPGDVVNDSTVAWPDSRRLVDLGEILVTTPVPDSAEVEKKMGFVPTNVVVGIEPSNDPLFAASRRCLLCRLCPPHAVAARPPSLIHRKRRQRGNGSKHIESRDREQEDYEDPGEHDGLHRFDGSNLLTLAAT